MTQAPAPELSDIAQALCAALILMVPLAAAGLALIHAGLGRSRSAAHAMLGAVLAVAVAALAYFVCGYSWQGFPGRPAHAFTVAGKAWSWIGAEPFFLRGLALDASPAALAAWLRMFGVGIAALIPLGAGSDRWRLGASCASTALLAGWTYPLFAHWVWGGGWLAQLGANLGLGYGFLDRGRRRGHSGGGRPDRPFDCLDTGSAPWEVCLGRHAGGYPGPQRGAGAVRLLPDLAGMDWPERRREPAAGGRLHGLR